jgi:uncharacterized protein YbaP (TraB family)
MKLFSAKALSLIGLTLFFSCKQRPSFPTAKDGKSLLWEISGNGLKAPSYYYGTMHLMCAEDAVLSSNVNKIIQRVKGIYLEVDLDNAGELLSGILDLSMKGHKQLSDYLAAEEYQRVKTFFEHYQPNLPFSVLERQHPLMLSSSLYELFLPCEKKNGIELRIVDAAYKAKKYTKGLETLAFQSSIFDSIPYDQQAKDLVKTIDSIGKFRNSMEEMLAVYKSQDLERLQALTMQEDSSVSGHMDILLYKRNHNWVEQFDSIAHKNSTLFAVGAGHLGGEKGVLNLLKQKGYSIRPLVN